ncbi:MAG TPA: SHOCT domain-containing protein [Nitrososphaeraceae archaeon]|jgi:putative oligomerization/nucleic acid binding protein|nr:SHOCT domain-containing protein [Nitrososphaeraceae archaeon]
MNNYREAKRFELCGLYNLLRMSIGNLKLEKIGLFIVVIIIDIMRGRWASAAIGAGIARNRAAGQAQAQDQAHQAEMAQLNAQHEKEMAQMQQQNAQQSQKPSGQEDVTQKLQKLADLKKQGILSEEEFQKLKMELLAKL